MRNPTHPKEEKSQHMDMLTLEPLRHDFVIQQESNIQAIEGVIKPENSSLPSIHIPPARKKNRVMAVEELATEPH